MGRYHKCHHSIFFNKWSSLSLFFLGFCFHGNFFVLFWIFVFTEKNGYIDFFTWWWHNWYIHKVIHNTFPLGRKPSYFRIRKYLFFIFALCLFGENRILALWTCQNINLLQPFVGICRPIGMYEMSIVLLLGIFFLGGGGF